MKCDRCGKEINNKSIRLCQECDEILEKQIIEKLENGNNDILELLDKFDVEIDGNYKLIDKNKKLNILNS